MSPDRLAAMAAAGVAAGVVNTLAGGGSLVSLPALLLLGLPAGVANATNRFGVVVQSAVAARRYRAGGVLDASEAATLLPSSCLGALLGAGLSVGLDEAMLRRAIALAMLAVLVAMWSRPERWLAGGGPAAALRKPRPARHVLFFAIGVYGGFVQAGVGVFLLVALALSGGHDLLRANAVKVVLVMGFTLVALCFYVLQGMVAWGPALALAAGSAAGARLGAGLSMRHGPALIRAVLSVVVVASAWRLL